MYRGNLWRVWTLAHLPEAIFYKIHQKHWLHWPFYNNLSLPPTSLQAPRGATSTSSFKLTWWQNQFSRANIGHSHSECMVVENFKPMSFFGQHDMECAKKTPVLMKHLESNTGNSTTARAWCWGPSTLKTWAADPAQLNHDTVLEELMTSV